MPIPVWVPGQVLSAADVNSWFVPLLAMKPGDEGPFTSTTLQNDDDLVLQLAASAKYAVDGYLVCTGNAIGTGDIKLGFTVPTGATYRFSAFGFNIGGTPPASGNSPALSTSTASVGINGASSSPVLIRGVVTTASTSGPFQLQWAPNTGGGTGTAVLAGSWLMARRAA